MELFYRIKNKFIIDQYQLTLLVDSKKIYYQGSLSEVKFEFCKINDIEEMRNNYKDEFSERKYELYKKRINDKDKIIIIIKINEEICGYCNISLVSQYESGIAKYILVNKNEAYFYDDYVFKKYRGESIQRMSILYRLEIAKSLKRRVVYVNIYRNNKPSLASYKKVGFEIIREYRRNVRSLC